MSFWSPGFLWLLLFLPLFWYLKWQYIPQNILPLKSSPSFLKKYGVDIIINIAYTSFIIASALPNISDIVPPQGEEGIDIMIALDLSETMLAEDLMPNRLEAAKRSIDTFLAEREGDRVGMILFAGKAFTHIPLTFSSDIIRSSLEDISTDSINQNVSQLRGTAVGDAILLGVKRLLSANEEMQDRTKILILITDGDANTGSNPLLAALKAKEEGIKVYAIGVGSEKGAPLKVTDAFGNEQYARKSNGELFMATFNEESLKQIAKETSGEYFRADDNDRFSQVLEQIADLEKTSLEREGALPRKDISYFFVWIGVLSLSIGAIYYLYSVYCWRKILKKEGT